MPFKILAIPAVTGNVRVVIFHLRWTARFAFRSRSKPCPLREGTMTVERRDTGPELRESGS